MAFQTGLSGLNAASRNLDVIGHNIANANTVGMKSSRAEFSELVASSIGVSGSNNFGAGLGVSVATVSQQFTQGNLNLTGNNLDIAINGSGFFQLTQADGSAAYTRDGQFKLDKEGNLVTNSGANVMGYPTDTAGVTTSITPQKISVPSGAPYSGQSHRRDHRGVQSGCPCAPGCQCDPTHTADHLWHIHDGLRLARC